MHRSRKTVLSYGSFFNLSLFILVFHSLMFSQPKGNPVDRMTERLKKQLSLTDEQASKVSALIKSTRESSLKDTDTYQNNKAESRKAWQARFEKFDLNMRAILTDKQIGKYEKIKGQIRDRLRVRQQGQRKGYRE